MAVDTNATSGQEHRDDVRPAAGGPESDLEAQARGVSPAKWDRVQRLAARYQVLDATPLTSARQADRIERDLHVITQQLGRLLAGRPWHIVDGRLELD